jgi:hypothetical protein
VVDLYQQSRDGSRRILDYPRRPEILAAAARMPVMDVITLRGSILDVDRVRERAASLAN